MRVQVNGFEDWPSSGTTIHYTLKNTGEQFLGLTEKHCVIRMAGILLTDRIDEFGEVADYEITKIEIIGGKD